MSRGGYDHAWLVSSALAKRCKYLLREGRAFDEEPTITKAAEWRILDSVVLTLNAGSSSLKFAAFRLAHGGEPNLLA
jgi:hypothetical protein